MNVLVISPPNTPYTDKGLLIEPIDALTTATFVQNKGHKVQFLDMDHKEVRPQDVAHVFFGHALTLIIFDYHIPLYSNECASDVNALITMAHKNDSRCVLIGKMAQHFPQRFPDADIIIHNEAEGALEEILAGRPLEQIAGITYRKKTDEEIKTSTTQARATQYTMDQIPIPDRSLVEYDEYIDVRSILSSRGCPQKCTFCPTPGFWGRWRSRSPKHVVDEIEYLATTCHAKKILFLDDNTTVDKRRMKKIAQLITERGIKTTLGCLGTAIAYDEETVKLMREAGFRWIHYGGEAASAKVLLSIKKNMSVEKLHEAIIGTKKHGMRVRTSWIFDLPAMEEEDVQKTMDFILETQPEEVRAHFLALRPGAELHAMLAGETFTNPYIHRSVSQQQKPWLANMMRTFCEKMRQQGYTIIEDPSEWQDVERLRKTNPEMKFLSFCPMRYGMDWVRA